MNIHPYIIILPDDEIYNEDTEEFIKVKGKKVVLEHSLYSISLWEMIHNKCFLKHFEHLTKDEIVSYIMCMSIGDDITEDDVIYMLSKSEIQQQIVRYLNRKMSATYIRESQNNRPSTEAQTSELFYYFLIKLQAPVELIEHWHISRLISLLTVFNAKDDTKHKRSVREIMTDNNALNEARKKQLGTKG